jgi:hypothetical protein
MASPPAVTGNGGVASVNHPAHGTGDAGERGGERRRGRARRLDLTIDRAELAPLVFAAEAARRGVIVGRGVDAYTHRAERNVRAEACEFLEDFDLSASIGVGHGFTL